MGSDVYHAIIEGIMHSTFFIAQGQEDQIDKEKKCNPVTKVSLFGTKDNA